MCVFSCFWLLHTHTLHDKLRCLSAVVWMEKWCKRSGLSSGIRSKRLLPQRVDRKVSEMQQVCFLMRNKSWKFLFLSSPSLKSFWGRTTEWQRTASWTASKISPPETWSQRSPAAPSPACRSIWRWLRGSPCVSRSTTSSKTRLWLLKLDFWVSLAEPVSEYDRRQTAPGLAGPRSPEWRLKLIMLGFSLKLSQCFSLHHQTRHSHRRIH